MMRNFLCWDPRTVREVINPYAEHIADSLFRAVHSDWDLMVSPPVGKSFQALDASSYEVETPPHFLSDFMRADRPHALAVVLGETGSGKSHLIHWMRLNLEKDASRVVLVVRKSGTSLRAIVRMIIDQLPTNQRGPFLDALDQAGDGVSTRVGQKNQLLNDLAQTIREDAVQKNAEEIEVELVRALPNLFQDPYMRNAHFMSDECVIAEIVDHIFAPSNAKDRPEGRRAFTEADLPLGGSDFIQASRLAQNVIQLIDLDPAHRPLAVKIINRNLERAISRTLSFSGDRVELLMVRLRIFLKEQKKELVLLVEEFARLQGIDRALLQAITAQGGDEQCKMRSAIAVTTGFFQTVAETAYMRTTHIVDMDRSAGRSANRDVTEESLSAFAARYLNAARLGASQIATWNAEAAPGDAAPSRCATCRFQPACHATFGAYDGYGLYPFTRRALWNAASRADPSMPNSINPRILQNNVLVEVLDNFAPQIEAGEFPPFRLLEKLGGAKMLRAAAVAQLQNSNPKLAPRWQALLEIYDGGDRVVNLSADLREAFSVPEIPGSPTAQPQDQPPHSTEAAQGPASGRVATKEDLAIEAFARGEGIDQAVATRLRELLFAAIVDAIDWDMLGLAPASFAQPTNGSFRRAGIVFDGQTTQVPGHLQVKLLIPGAAVTSAQAGLALQGLVKASKAGFKWEFEDGHRMLSAFLDCIGAWKRSVEDQLKSVAAPTATWKLSDASLDLLCVGAALGGRIKPNASLADMIDGAFSSLPEECASTSSEMTAIYRKIVKNRDKLVVAARAQISSMKGGRVGAMISPHLFIDKMRSLRKGKWRLELQPLASDTSDLAKLYRETQQALGPAAQAEFDLRAAWLNTMDEAFGPEATRSTIFATLSDAQKIATEAGIPLQGTSRPLSEALDAFKGVLYDDLVNASRALVRQEEPIAALPHFGRGRRGAVEAANALRSAAANFLDAIDRNLKTYGSEHGAEQDAVLGSVGKIDAALAAIETNLVTLSLSSKENPSAA